MAARAGLADGSGQQPRSLLLVCPSVAACRGTTSALVTLVVVDAGTGGAA